MSDFEKGRQRRYYSLNKDRKDGPMLGRRRPIILAKPERDRDRDGDKDRDGASKPSTSAGKTTTQPTIILRTREGENRAVSPSQRANTVLRKDGDTQQTPLYQLAAKPSSGENANPLAPPPEMKSAIKLIDESFQFCDGCLEYLLDQNDFMVVGCLGLQGTGKSTIMSLLAGCDVSGKTGFCFKPQGLEHHELGGHCTSGIDIYVTGNRVIMLDTQPMLSASVMDRLVQQEGKKFVGTEFAASTENAMEIQSLQLAAFLLSVCHIVILVQDWFFDPNILRFLQSAEMLKPSTPTTSQDEEIIEYFPHIMFLHNKASTSEFSPLQVKLMQNVYNKTFLRSRLQIQSGMGIATGSTISCLTPEICGEPINLYLLPNMDDKEGDRYYRGHPGFTNLISKLRNQILGVTLQPITHTVLSEKNWFHYASKVWDGIKKSNFFMEYSRLLP